MAGKLKNNASRVVIIAFMVGFLSVVEFHQAMMPVLAVHE